MKDIEEFAANHGVSAEDFIRQNQTDIEYYINNKGIYTEHGSEKLEHLVENYKYAIQVNYIRPITSRHDLLKVLIDFKRNMINRQGVNVAGIIYHISVMEKGHTLRINLEEMPLFIEATDQELLELDAEYIHLIISSKNEEKKKWWSKKIMKPKKK